jgi:hypothetical protein
LCDFDHTHPLYSFALIYTKLSRLLHNLLDLSQGCLPLVPLLFLPLR